MSHLILIRHGQSEWNLQNRFTGWVDVELAPNGKLEACKAGELIKEKNLEFDYFFSSHLYLIRLNSHNVFHLIPKHLKLHHL